MKLREQVSQEERKRLRKIRVPSPEVKAHIYTGNQGGTRMAVQFNEDCRLYGLWEALLYVEQYESQHQYAIGTAHRAYTATLPTPAPTSEPWSAF